MNSHSYRIDLRDLRCPQCRSGLLLHEPESIRCQGPVAHEFPIVRGIPRFAGESYIESFGVQWNRYEVIRPEMDIATFQAKTGCLPQDLAGKKVLDAGVGGGRYARYTDTAQALPMNHTDT